MLCRGFFFVTIVLLALLLGTTECLKPQSTQKYAETTAISLGNISDMNIL